MSGCTGVEAEGGAGLRIERAEFGQHVGKVCAGVARRQIVALPRARSRGAPRSEVEMVDQRPHRRGRAGLRPRQLRGQALGGGAGADRRWARSPARWRSTASTDGESGRRAARRCPPARSAPDIAGLVDLGRSAHADQPQRQVGNGEAELAR